MRSVRDHQWSTASRMGCDVRDDLMIRCFVDHFMSQWNTVKDSGAQALAVALKSNTSIETINAASRMDWG